MISLIVCTDRNNAIGKNNELLYKLKDDMKWFKKKTEGKIVVMGRKTYESLGKALPNRQNLILSKNYYYAPDAITTDFETIINMSLKFSSQEIMIIGGQQIYELFLPYASRIYQTDVDHEVEGADTFFPSVKYDEWELYDASDIYLADDRNEHPFRTLSYRRKLS